MTTAPVKTLIDEQLDEVKAQVRVVLTYTRSTLIRDLPQMKADWLKRRPMERRL